MSLNQSEKRKDKIHICRIPVTSRIYGWITEGVHVLNLIDVIYVKDEAVRIVWKNLLEADSSTE